LYGNTYRQPRAVATTPPPQHQDYPGPSDPHRRGSSLGPDAFVGVVLLFVGAALLSLCCIGGLALDALSKNRASSAAPIGRAVAPPEPPGLYQVVPGGHHRASIGRIGELTARR
jgi:hypothetical protein